MWPDTVAVVYHQREGEALSEVPGDCLFRLPEVPSAAEVTKMYLRYWDVKISIRGWRGEEADYNLHPNGIRANEGSFTETCIS